MICPRCSKPLKMASIVFHNVDAYRNPVVARTSCCQKLVVVRPISSYSVTEYDGDRTKDDWGS